MLYCWVILNVSICGLDESFCPLQLQNVRIILLSVSNANLLRFYIFHNVYLQFGDNVDEIVIVAFLTLSYNI